LIFKPHKCSSCDTKRSLVTGKKYAKAGTYRFAAGPGQNVWAREVLKVGQGGHDQKKGSMKNLPRPEQRGKNQTRCLTALEKFVTGQQSRKKEAATPAFSACRGAKKPPCREFGLGLADVISIWGQRKKGGGRIFFLTSLKTPER